MPECKAAPKAEPMIQLRDYQIRSTDDVLSDETNVCLVSPTGSGKTTMGAHIALAYSGSHRSGHVVWIAHTRELVQQARATLEAWGVRSFEIYTIQSLPAHVDCTLLVVDECHHYTAEWRQLLKRVTFARLVGLTATPARADGKALRGLFDRLVIAAHYSELLKAGHICRCKVVWGPPIEGLAQHPLEAWKQHGAKRFTLAYAPSVELAMRWSEEFRWAQIRSDYIIGDLDDDDRADKRRRFARGELTVLWNVHILTEGVDIPHVSCLLLARQVESFPLFLQIIGRGLRTSAGKDNCVLIDLTRACDRFNYLPGTDCKYSIDGRNPIQRGKVIKIRQCGQCAAVCKSWRQDCPECGYVTPRESMPVKIFDEKLSEVFDGRETSVHEIDAALARMRKQQLDEKRPLWWLIKTFKANFGINPVIRDATREERALEWERLRYICATKVKQDGTPFKIGWAVHQFKTRFGSMPEGFSWSRGR